MEAKKDGTGMGSGGEVYHRAEELLQKRRCCTVVDEVKEKTRKIGHITLYTKFFAVTGTVP